MHIQRLYFLINWLIVRQNTFYGSIVSAYKSLSRVALDILVYESVIKYIINPLPDDKILHWSKLKQIADDI